MSINSAKTGSTGLSLALDNNYMEPIASTLVGAGGVNTVIFNDIPQNYKHLQLRVIAQVVYPTDPGGPGGILVNFNGDSSTNYTRHLLSGDGSVAGAYSAISQSAGAIERFNYLSTSDNIYGAAVSDILDYSSTNKYKTLRSIGGVDKNGTAAYPGEVYLNSFLWMNTAPITSIKIFTGGYTFRQHSRFSLYGIKG